MIPWELLDTSPVPGDSVQMRLYRRGDEYAIIVDNVELMNSRLHGSEDALAELTCTRIADRPAPRVLIGGLGMGFTLAAALGYLNDDSAVVVAELVPAVVAWNQEYLGHLTGHPLEDPRVETRVGDVFKAMKKRKGDWDAILLDVDNGPEGLTRKENDKLYEPSGLAVARDALRPGGVLAVWSSTPDPAFTERLQRMGFANVEDIRVRARSSGRGAWHTIWIARRAN